MTCAAAGRTWVARTWGASQDERIQGGTICRTIECRRVPVQKPKERSSYVGNHCYRTRGAMAVGHGVVLHAGRLHPPAVGPCRHCDPRSPGAGPLNMMHAGVASSRPEEGAQGNLAVETATT